jgi:hypothetical protein
MKIETIQGAFGHFSDEIIAEADTNILEKPKSIISKRQVYASIIAAACLMIAVVGIGIPMNSITPPLAPVETDITGITEASAVSNTTVATGVASNLSVTTVMNERSLPPQTAPNIPSTTNNPVTGLPTVTPPLITGLPVDTDNTQQGAPPTPPPRFESLFLDPHFEVQSFIFIKVTDIQQTGSSQGEWGNYSTLIFNTQVLSTVWNRGNNISQTIALESEIFNNRTLSPLREGGVYLVALGIFHEYNEGYSDFSDYYKATFKALFEVDDEGKIWAMPQYRNNGKSLDEFDGKPTSIISQAILDITSDKYFDAIVGLFGIEAGRNVLVEVTVLPGTTIGVAPRMPGITYPDDYVDEDFVLYNLKLNNTLSLPLFDTTTWNFKNGDVFIGTAALECFDEPLEIGGRYLMFVSSFAHIQYCSSFLTAKINSNGVITALNVSEYYTGYGFSSRFTEFNGYTPAQVASVVGRVQTWYDKHYKQN